MKCRLTPIFEPLTCRKETIPQKSDFIRDLNSFVGLSLSFCNSYFRAPPLSHACFLLHCRRTRGMLNNHYDLEQMKKIYLNVAVGTGIQNG